MILSAPAAVKSSRKKLEGEPGVFARIIVARNGGLRTSMPATNVLMQSTNIPASIVAKNSARTGISTENTVSQVVISWLGFLKRKKSCFYHLDFKGPWSDV